MLLTEYNQEEALRVRGEEEREQGRKEGELKGREETKEKIAVELLDVLDTETIAKKNSGKRTYILISTVLFYILFYIP